MKCSLVTVDLNFRGTNASIFCVKQGVFHPKDEYACMHMYVPRKSGYICTKLHCII
jgi:hypothetical protein